MKDYKTQYQLWKYWLNHPPFLWYDVCMAMVSSGLDWSGYINLVWSNIYLSKVVSSCLVWSRPSSLMRSGVVWKKDFKSELWSFGPSQQPFWQSDDKQMNDDNHVIQEQACSWPVKRHYLAILYSRSCCWWDTRQELLHKSCGMWLVMCGMWYVTCHMSSVSQVIS